jgi:hypothetical protein
MRLVELVIPGIIGAGLALLGVWYTNKNNAITNAANRQHDAANNAAHRLHELDKLDREHTFALKRDSLIRLTQSFVQTVAALKQWADSTGDLLLSRTYEEEGSEKMKEDIEKESKHWAEYMLRRTELDQTTASACLAISNDLWLSAQELAESITKADNEVDSSVVDANKMIEKLGESIASFVRAARRELGIVHIDA